MLSQLIKNSLEQCISKVSEGLGILGSSPVNAALEQPANAEHGDYSSNIAMQLARTLRKPPAVIAELITAELKASGSANGLLQRIEVAPPGFINMYIDWQVWAQTDFALPQAGGEKVIVEHTSVNPNKSMHIGHLRNSCIGDALARILRKTGHTVEVHNYVDDLGNQLADTVVGLLNVPLAGNHVRFGDYCWDIYAEINKEYAQHPESVHKRTEILHALEQGHGNTAWIGNLVAGQIVKEHVEEMRNFGIGYDLLVWESSILKEGFWASAFDLLSQTEVFVQESEGKLAGCWILKQSAGGGDSAQDTEEEHQKDKVLVRSNGILTYTAKDIAYHLWKFGLLDKDFAYSEFNSGLWTTGLSGEVLPFGHADKVVNVIDYRQEYPQAMVKQAFQALGYHEQAERLHHVSYGVVSLSPASAAGLGLDTSAGKSSYAMSGRQGIGIKVTELVRLMEDSIDATRSDKNGLSSRLIATAAIRYYLLRFNLGTEIVFDFKQAMEISGNTGVYLMYAYARASRVLSKGGALAESGSGNSGNSRNDRDSADNLYSANSIDKSDNVDSIDQKEGDLPLFPLQLEAAELALLRQLSLWQDTLYTASRELTPNTICNYAHSLAALFSNFYSACPILKGEASIVAFRLWLTRRFTGTLGEALDVLGLPKPERM
ncbi:arginine--tRNA ligase [Paenibacillus borealis]|uniref:Arginine--tRNA ligase n=1 Tax=Paenibacillus borealis TaxID=160799 RepID=A0A089LI63_PAEBO|nr:arginine--tRNA ligase [Paenibacillus borealis]AIQ60562.1 arginyl-tRNA synthetase [Paenibacillus borealis]